MKRYSRAELVAFLRRVDALLTKPEVLEVIGGAAAVLKYGARAPTKDIDTWNRVPKAVQDAADAVGAAGQGVPLAPAGVAEIPNDAELRFCCARQLMSATDTLDGDLDLRVSKWTGSTWQTVCSSNTWDSSWELCDIDVNAGEQYQAALVKYSTNAAGTYVGIAWNNYDPNSE